MLLFTEIVFIMDLIYTCLPQKSTVPLIFLRKNSTPDHTTVFFICCMERAALTATDDCARTQNLPPSIQTAGESSAGSLAAVLGDDSSKLEVLLANYERETRQEAIRKNDGNLSAAGRKLGLSLSA